MGKNAWKGHAAMYNRKNELCKNSKRIVQAEFIYYPLEAHY